MNTHSQPYHPTLSTQSFRKKEEEHEHLIADDFEVPDVHVPKRDDQWEEFEEDEHVRSLYKAEKLLDDVVYR